MGAVDLPPAASGRDSRHCRRCRPPGSPCPVFLGGFLAAGLDGRDHPVGLAVELLDRRFLGIVMPCLNGTAWRRGDFGVLDRRDPVEPRPRSSWRRGCCRSWRTRCRSRPEPITRSFCGMRGTRGVAVAPDPLPGLEPAGRWARAPVARMMVFGLDGLIALSVLTAILFCPQALHRP